MISEPSSPLVVCGVIGDSTTMIVNKSLTGPFKNRYDLVTMPLVGGIALSEAVNKVTQLQTGLQTIISKQLGTVQFTIPTLAALAIPTTLISIFYLLEPVGGQLITKRPSYTTALSAGAARVALTQLNWHNSSPAVMQAKRFLLTGAFPTDEQRIAGYTIHEQEQFISTDV